MTIGRSGSPVAPSCRANWTANRRFRSANRWPTGLPGFREARSVSCRGQSVDPPGVLVGNDPGQIRRELLRLSGRTAYGLRAGGYVARTVSVKLRLASFKTLTRSRTLPYPTDVAREIYTTACALYEGAGLDPGAQLRLVGVRASGLTPAAGANAQLTLDDKPVGWREAERAVDQIARRFGASAVRPAALVEDPETS